MSQPQGERRRRVSGWIRGIGNLRDGLLILATGTYGLGYIVWSAHATQEGLGLLPALEPQYFAAGVIPAVLLWLAYVGFKAARELPDRVVKWRDRQTGKWPTIWRAVGFVCFLSFYVSFYMGIRLEKNNQLVASRMLYLGILGSVLIVSGLLLLLPSPNEVRWVFSPRVSPRAVRVLMYSYLAIYLAALGASYLFFVYPKLPQEFGGVRPRCAYIDVVRDQVSESIRKGILPGDAAESKGAVVQSLRMQVFFSGTEFMLIRPYPEGPQANIHKPKLLELRKTVVQAVNWCD